MTEENKEKGVGGGARLHANQASLGKVFIVSAGSVRREDVRRVSPCIRLL